MYSYIIGEIIKQEANFIVLDNNKIGYKIYTPNPYAFKENTEYKVFLYQHVKEDDLSLYGFKLEEEKNLFLKLIDVKGVGPKTALPILATGSVEGIIYAIEKENILYLKKFPKIGDKVARQIILDLKGKLVSTSDVVIPLELEELTSALSALGYKTNDVKKITPNIDRNLNIEDQIKQALKLLLK